MIRPVTIRTLNQLHEVVEAYSDFNEFAFDVETLPTRKSRDPKRDKPGLDSTTNRVFWLALAGPMRVDVIPLGHPTGPRQLGRSAVFEALKPIFFSDRRKIGHNVKFDLLSIAKYYGDVCPPPPYGDTMTAVHLLDENWGRKGGFNLENLVKQYLHYEYEEKLGAKASTVSFDRAARYVGLDAGLTWVLWKKMWRRYQDPKRKKLLDLFNMEMEVLEVLLSMYQTGAYVNKTQFGELQRTLRIRARDAETKVYQLAGREFNLNSPKQKAEYFYGELGLKCEVFTDKGAESTDAEAIGKLAKKNPVAKALQGYADINKLLSTYVEGYIPHIGEDSRIRASFNQSIPVTGRFSCSSPNLQNVPIRANESYESQLIRGLFTAPQGSVLVVGDFGQIELRILASICGDPTLLKAYREDIDLHTLTASKVFSVSIDKVNKEQRAIGKMSNFNLAFEGGPGRIMEAGGITEKEARRVFDAWHRAYPGVRGWGKHIKKFCWEFGYVETLYGRKRRLPEIRSGNDKLRSSAERQAVNHPIQGSAADIAKIALVEIHRVFEGTPAKLVMQVHDEFIAEVPSSFAEEALQLMKGAMEGVKLRGKPVLKVPLVADVHFGKTWSEAK